MEETTPHPEPVLIDEAEPLPDASEIDDVYDGDASVTSGVGKNRGKVRTYLVFLPQSCYVRLVLHNFDYICAGALVLTCSYVNGVHARVCLCLRHAYS